MFNFLRRKKKTNKIKRDPRDYTNFGANLEFPIYNGHLTENGRRYTSPQISRHDLHFAEEQQAFYSQDNHIQDQTEFDYPEQLHNDNRSAGLRASRPTITTREYSSYSPDPEYFDDIAEGEYAYGISQAQQTPLPAYEKSEFFPELKHDKYIPDQTENNSNSTASFFSSLIGHAPFFALTIIALIHTLNTASLEPLSISEAQNWYLTTLNSTDAAKAISDLGRTPYFTTLLRTLISYLGDSKIVLRLPSVVSFLLCLIAIYVGAIKLFKKEIAIALVALTAFSSTVQTLTATSTSAMLLMALATFFTIHTTMVARSNLSINIILSAVTSLALIIFYPPAILFVSILMIGSLIDALGNIKEQFLKFLPWCVSQFATLILGSLYIKYEQFKIYYTDDWQSGVSHKFTQNLIILVPNAYYAAPIIIGLIFTIYTLSKVRSDRENNINPSITWSLLLGSVLTFFVSFAVGQHFTDNEFNIFILFSLTPTLLFVGLAYRSTSERYSGEISTLLVICSLVSYFTPSTDVDKKIDLKGSLQYMNASAENADCIFVYPSSYQYSVWYGLDTQPDCYVPINSADEFKNLFMNTKGSHVILFEANNNNTENLVEKFAEIKSIKNTQQEIKSFSGIDVIKIVKN